MGKNRVYSLMAAFPYQEKEKKKAQINQPNRKTQPHYWNPLNTVGI